MQQYLINTLSYVPETIGNPRRSTSGRGDQEGFGDVYQAWSRRGRAESVAPPCSMDPCRRSRGRSRGRRAGRRMAQYSAKSTPYWKSLVARFEKANPKIKVDLKVIDWNTLLQQVPTMISTRNYPDVLNFNAYSTFAASGLLQPAKDVLSPGTEADFESSFLGSDSIKGTQYAIPWIASVRLPEGRHLRAAHHLGPAGDRRAQGQ